MTSSNDTKPRHKIMEVEEISGKEEEKEVTKKDAIPPIMLAPQEKEEEEKEIKDTMESEPSSLTGLATEQQKEASAPRDSEETPKKDIVSELFHPTDTQVPYPTVTAQKKPKRFSFVIWVILLFVIVGCIGGGLLLFKQQSSGATEESPQGNNATITLSSTPSPTEMQTPASPSQGGPTPTASASAKKKEITVQVWNGSGKSGAASLMKELLEEKGYTVKSTGNAPSFSKDQTAIYVKKSKKDYLDLLKNDIGEKYSLGTTSATLDESLGFDARVIVGEE